MWFIRMGTVVAWFTLIAGAAQLALGWYIALSYPTAEGMVAASKRYANASNSGEIINEAIPLIAAGLVLGLLATIARNTSRSRE